MKCSNKNCKVDIKVIDPDNYVVDRRTNDVYCSNGCLLDCNKPVRQRKGESEKKYIVKKRCPICGKTIPNRSWQNLCYGADCNNAVMVKVRIVK